MQKEEMTELVNQGLWLPLMEQFYTIQGEGNHTGTAAYFVRIGGCDVGCHWCDVKESWNAEIHPPSSIEKIVEEVKKYAEVVVVTGGEPLTWNMQPLTDILHQNQLKVHIETSGCYPVTGTWDWFCLSPKKNKLPVAEAYEYADELKVIVHNKHDFIFAEGQAAKLNKKIPMYLQPEWSKREQMTPMIVDYVMQHPQWKVSLQTHKYLNIP